MRVFGLTGGIASGKTAVARRFESQGVPVVFADDLARKVVEKGSPGLAAIVARFGADVLEDGELSRKKLGARVFGHPEELAALNAIVHPRVAELSQRTFAELAQQGAELVCYEVPLLVENGLSELFRPVVVVTASEPVQLERLMRRDGLDEPQARARIGSQLSADAKRKVADFVIENDGDWEALQRRADDVLLAIRAGSRLT